MQYKAGQRYSLIWTVHLSIAVSPTYFLPLHLYMCLYLYLYLSLSLYLNVYLCLDVYLYLNVYLCLDVYLYLNVHLYLNVYLHLYLYLYYKARQRYPLTGQCIQARPTDTDAYFLPFRAPLHYAKVVMGRCQ